MGKREEVKKPKSARDFYATIDPDAVTPLLPYLAYQSFAELCAGEGDLVKLLHSNGVRCSYAIDIEYTSFLRTNGYWGDALDVTELDLEFSDCIVTNPPFTKSVLLPLIDHFVTLKPTWLLLPADMLHNKYMTPYMKKCELVLSIGRLCWFPVNGKKVKGVDNFIWAKFVSYETPTTFVGRL